MQDGWCLHVLRAHSMRVACRAGILQLGCLDVLYREKPQGEKEWLGRVLMPCVLSMLQAACLGANDIVQLLLDAGADMGAVDAQGFTGGLWVAWRRG